MLPIIAVVRLISNARILPEYPITTPSELSHPICLDARTGVQGQRTLMTARLRRSDTSCAQPDRTSRKGPSPHPQLRTRWVALLILLVVIGATGCGMLKDWAHHGFKVGPEYGRPAAPIATAWIDEYNEKIATELPPNPMWWETFNDPILNQLVQSVHQQNLTLRSAGMAHPDRSRSVASR